MKKLIFLFSIAVSSFSSLAGEIVLETTYNGKNVFVSNPVHADGTFCTITVYVNGQKMTDHPNSSSYEINLKQMGFNVGDPVKVTIVHNESCVPTILSQHP